MMFLRRKEITILVLALLVALAGYLNIAYKSRAEDEIAANERMGEVKLVNSDKEEDSFLAEARLDREISRSAARETLSELIDNKNTGQSAREQAQKEVIDMAKIMDMETTAEGLIKAKGFEDAVIYISDGKVSAMVKADKLSGGDVSKIQEIITEITGIPAENIKIVEVK